MCGGCVYVGCVCVCVCVCVWSSMGRDRGQKEWQGLSFLMTQAISFCLTKTGLKSVRIFVIVWKYNLVVSSFSFTWIQVIYKGNFQNHNLLYGIEWILNHKYLCFSSVQSLSHVRLFATPWTAAHQASLSVTNSQSLLKLMSIELVMPSNHLTICCPLLLLPSIFPSIRVSSKESVLPIRGKVLEFQLQHQSFQWIFRTDFL